MPRNRMIRPEFWDDERLATISRDARLTFIGLWNYSDDYGVVKGHPTWLKNKIYPYDEIKIEIFQKWLAELERIVCIMPFEADGEKFYYIRAFTTHQKINRPSEQRNPEPPQQILEDSRSTHGVLTPEVKLSKREEKLSKGNFIPPTLIEVTEYCKERNNDVDPGKWFNFYKAKNWMIGKNKMVDWKAGVITWEKPKNGGNNGRFEKSNPPGDAKDDPYAGIGRHIDS